jgi:hypothetical protein
VNGRVLRVGPILYGRRPRCHTRGARLRPHAEVCFASACTATHSVRHFAAFCLATFRSAFTRSLSLPGRIRGRCARPASGVERIEACTAVPSRKSRPPSAPEEISVRHAAPRHDAHASYRGRFPVAPTPSRARPAAERATSDGRAGDHIGGNHTALETRDSDRPRHGPPADPSGRSAGETQAGGPAGEGSSTYRRSSSPTKRSASCKWFTRMG